MSETKIYGIRQQCTNPVCQITMTTAFCTVVPNNCAYSVHVTILMHRILRLLVGFLEILCNPRIREQLQQF